MKIRSSFVSNSSSSSFVCDVCGKAEGGWDMCLGDVDMCRCVNDHTFHTNCAFTKEEKSKVKHKLEKEFGGDWMYSIPESMCPICSLTKIPKGDIFKYLLLEINRSLQDMSLEIKERFKTREQFEAYLKKGKS